MELNFKIQDLVPKIYGQNGTKFKNLKYSTKNFK